MRGNRKSSSQLCFALILTAIFVALGIFLIFHHEPWRDEANPWQIAKVINLNNLFEVTKYEPHSPLYPLMLAPFAQAGLPYITTNFISLAIVSLAVFLLVWRAPFKGWQKILIIFSAGFFYYNSVIARDYSLIALGIVLVGLTYSGRHTYPIRYALSLALLSQSHMLAGGITATLAVGFFVECIKQKALKTAIVPFIILTLAFLILLPPVLTTLSDHQIISASLKGDHLPLSAYLTNFDESLYGVVLPVFETGLAFVLIYLLARFPKIFIYASIGFAYYFVVLLFVYNTQVVMPQKSATAILILTLVIWLTYAEQRKMRNRFNRFILRSELYKFISYYVPISTFCFLPIILTIPHTFSEAINDIDHEYSYAYSVSDQLNNLEEDAVILTASDDTTGIAITFVPLLQDERMIYDTVTGTPLNYMIYDAIRTEASDEKVEAAISEFAERPLYIMTRFNNCDNLVGEATIADNWEKIAEYRPDNRAYESMFRLYKIH